MLIISYDIHDDKLRSQFAKALCKHGAIRLQFSVYEIRNTKRILENLKMEIDHRFAKKFSGGDSVMIFETPDNSIKKYGNAIHRDQDFICF